MRPAGDGGVVDAQAHPDLTGAPGEHGLPRRRERLAERLEREWAEQERAERARRERIERERAERERALRERRERRLRERREKLRREREALRRRPRRVRDSAGPGPPPAGRSTAARKQPSTSARTPPPAAGGTLPSATSVRIRPGVKGPVRKRVRSGENRRRVAARRRGLFWPTAKAGIAVSVVLALSAGLASVLGLAVPALDPGAGRQSLANSAALFGVDPGTPTGLSPGYVFPIVGPHDLGDKLARFGAPRYGHIHEGQDIFAKSGRPEVAVHDGVVVDRGTVSDAGDGGRGNYMAIYSPPDDRSFVYMHMLKPSRVQLGDQVHSGEVIGEVGCTGGCDGPHLHFEVRIGKATIGADTKPVDPLPYLRQWPQVTPG